MSRVLTRIAVESVGREAEGGGGDGEDDSDDEAEDYDEEEWMSKF
jgi:hypothetical protein